MLFYGFLGLWVGVLLNGIIDRLSPPTAGKPFSRCLACGVRPATWDWVPVVGFIVGRGRCASCGARWSGRAPLVELATAFLFALLWRSWGPSLLLVLYTIYFCLLVIILVIDVEHRLILNRLIWPAIALALLSIPMRAWLTSTAGANEASGAFSVLGWRGALSPWGASMLNLLLGGALGLAIFAVMWLVAPQGIGAGDVKLALFVGLLSGIPGVLWVVVGSFFLAGVAALALLVFRRAGLKSELPFAPFMVLTTMAVLLYGPQLTRWYLG